MFAEDGSFVFKKFSFMRTDRENLHTIIPELKDNIIKPGKYYLLILPFWNPNGHKNDEFKNVAIDIYCQQKIRISKVSYEFGLILLAQCCKDYFLQHK